MAVAKNSKVPTAKKGSAKTAAASEVKIVESPPRVSRRNAPVKTAVASPSPSPSRLKSSKKKSTGTASKKTKKVETEPESVEEGEEIEEVKAGKSVPVVPSKGKSRESNSCGAKEMIRSYLILYNTLSAIAWSVLLFNTGKSFLLDDPYNHQILFHKTGIYLAYLQTVALLEVLHAAMGWVRSGVVSNVIQIASRLFVIWVAGVYGGSGKHWAYGMMSVAWALSDFTRYAYYLTQLTDASVPILKWARYNFFLVLYPVGTLGEAILIYLARLKWAKNLALSYGLLAVLAIYTPGFLYMYSHMLQQRAKHFAIGAQEINAAEAVPSKQRRNKAK